MKKAITQFFFFCTLLTGTVFLFSNFHLIEADDRTESAIKKAAKIEGAWETQKMVDGKKVKQQILISGNSFAFTQYDADGGAFGYTMGGTWTGNKKQMKITYEFNTMDETQVGNSEDWSVKLKKGQLNISTSKGKTMYVSIDNPKQTALKGPYLFSGRKRNGELRMRDTNQPRKTMKILTGSHFQWIAYNTETKKFFGTGGGSYTAMNGKYIENIEFFSRDNNRVGASLSFDFEVKNGDWHHSGFSSKGDPMYEVWAKRN